MRLCIASFTTDSFKPLSCRVIIGNGEHVTSDADLTSVATRRLVPQELLSQATQPAVPDNDAKAHAAVKLEQEEGAPSAADLLRFAHNRLLDMGYSEGAVFAAMRDVRREGGAKAGGWSAGMSVGQLVDEVVRRIP